MQDDVRQLRPAQSKPRLIKINFPRCPWVCTTALQGMQDYKDGWTGYGSDPVSAYADWYRKNNGDKWTIG